MPREWLARDIDAALLGERIRQLRENQHMNRSQLAEWIGSSELTIRHWEEGKHVPRIALIDRLAAHFDVPVELLMPKKDAQS